MGCHKKCTLDDQAEWTYKVDELHRPHFHALCADFLYVVFSCLRNDEYLALLRGGQHEQPEANVKFRLTLAA